MTLSVPRDRAGTFDPKLITKYQRRFPDFDDKIISMYARGMTVREIRGHLEELYGIDVSPDLISAVTDAVWMRWLNGRTVRSISATRWCSSMPSGSRSATKASCATRRSISRSASCQTAPRRSSASGSNRPRAPILAARRQRAQDPRAQDILIAVVDGLKGFPEAINAVFPQTVVQTCIVHLIRHSMDFASWKDRKNVARHCGPLSRGRRRRWPGRPRGLRASPGARSIRRSPRLAPQLEPRDSVLRFP